MKQSKLFILLLLGMIFIGAWLGSAAAAGSQVLNGKYIMAFHACNIATVDCRDPRNHEVYIAQSDDGINWSPLSGYTPYSGSVPDLVRRGNMLYVYTPGQVRRYQIDTNTWKDAAPVSVSIKHGDGTTDQLFVDPCPILDENGKIVLFYLVGQLGGDPAQCQSGQSSCTKIFRSATEVSGSDGVSFLDDNGNRAEITINSPGNASDPDIFKGPDGYIMYIARDGGVQALHSADMRGRYENISGLPNGMLVSTGSGSVPSGYYDGTTGQYWTYVHTNEGNVTTIKRAVTSAVNTQIPSSSFTTIISGSTFPGLGSSYRVESPGFALNTTNICAATLSGSFLLQEPYFTINGFFLSLDLQYAQNAQFPSTDIMFKLANAGGVTDPTIYSSCQASTLSVVGNNYVLHIPIVILGGTSCWLDLTHVSTSDGLLWFKLTKYGVN